MDRLKAIECLVSAVECGTLSKAAEKLQISVAAVSRGVSELESHLGIRLLQRTSRRLVLTEGGNHFYQRGKQLLLDLEEAEAEASQTIAQPTGTLKVNVPVTFGIQHLAPLWPDFLQRYPELRLELSLSDQKVDVLEAGYDLVVRIAALPDSSLIARRIATTHSLLCAAPSYLARVGLPNHPDELSQMQAIGYSYARQRDEWNFQHIHSGQTARVTVPTHMQVNNGDTIRLAALSGMGVILQPSFLVGDDLKAGRLVQLLPEWQGPTYGVYALYPSRKHLSAKVRVLVDYLQHAFGAAAEQDPWCSLA